jgi:DNA-binding CsgD family transcriptional regulator
MSMADRRQPSRLRLRDARDLYLLVGKCRALGHDGAAWRRHLVVQLRKLLPCELSSFSDNMFVGEPNAPQGWIRPISIVDDWEHEENREIFWQYVRRGRPEEGNPMFDVFRSPFRLRVARRRDFVTDERWYGSAFYQEFASAIELDDFLCSVMQAPGGVAQAVVLHRQADAEPFSRRDAHFLRAILLEVQRLQPDELLGIDDSTLNALPRRMLQVLASLLAGRTVRETADILGVSAHTVQEHVKRLYKRSGAKNRAELADRYRHVAPLLVDLPPDEIPDHHQRIEQATKRPWPAAPAALADAGHRDLRRSSIVYQTRMTGPDHPAVN